MLTDDGQRQVTIDQPKNVCLGEHLITQLLQLHENNSFIQMPTLPYIIDAYLKKINNYFIHDTKLKQCINGLPSLHGFMLSTHS